MTLKTLAEEEMSPEPYWPQSAHEEVNRLRARVAELEEALQITERGECGHEGIGLALKQRTGELAEVEQDRLEQIDLMLRHAARADTAEARVAELEAALRDLLSAYYAMDNGVSYDNRIAMVASAARAALAEQPAATGEGTP